MGVTSKRKGGHTKAGGSKRRKTDDDDMFSSYGTLRDSNNPFWEADYVPEEISSDDESSEDEEEDFLRGAVSNDLHEVSKRFIFTARETSQIHSAYKEIHKGSAGETMQFERFIQESYRYINAREVSDDQKCSLSFWLRVTPEYLEVVEDLESINPDAPFESQSAWIHERWDNQTEDSLAHLKISSLLRRKHHPNLMPRRGRQGYATDYHDPDMDHEEDEFQTAQDDNDSCVNETAADNEGDDNSVDSTPTSNSDDDEEISESEMRTAVAKALFDLGKLEHLEYLGPLWTSLITIKREVKALLVKKKIAKAYLKVRLLRDASEQAVSLVVQHLRRMGMENPYKVEERENLLRLARQRKWLEFIRKVAEMTPDVREVTIGKHVE